MNFPWNLSNNKFPQVLDYSTSDLKFTQSLFQVLWDCSKGSNYDLYHLHLHIPQLLQLSSKVQVFDHLFMFLLSFIFIL